MDFLFLLEKVKLASSKSVSFSKAEKPLIFYCFLTNPIKILIQRHAFDEVDDFYERQQNFSQDFWKSLNMSVKCGN